MRKKTEKCFKKIILFGVFGLLLCFGFLSGKVFAKSQDDSLPAADYYVKSSWTENSPLPEGLKWNVNAFNTIPAAVAAIPKSATRGLTTICVEEGTYTEEIRLDSDNLIFTEDSKEWYGNVSFIAHGDVKLKNRFAGRRDIDKQVNNFRNISISGFYVSDTTDFFSILAADYSIQNVNISDNEATVTESSLQIVGFLEDINISDNIFHNGSNNPQSKNYSFFLGNQYDTINRLCMEDNIFCGQCAILGAILENHVTIHHNEFSDHIIFSKNSGLDYSGKVLFSKNTFETNKDYFLQVNGGFISLKSFEFDGDTFQNEKILGYSKQDILYMKQSFNGVYFYNGFIYNFDDNAFQDFSSAVDAAVNLHPTAENPVTIHLEKNVGGFTSDKILSHIVFEGADGISFSDVVDLTEANMAGTQFKNLIFQKELKINESLTSEDIYIENCTFCKSFVENLKGSFILGPNNQTKFENGDAVTGSLNQVKWEIAHDAVYSKDKVLFMTDETVFDQNGKIVSGPVMGTAKNINERVSDEYNIGFLDSGEVYYDGILFYEEVQNRKVELYYVNLDGKIVVPEGYQLKIHETVSAPTSATIYLPYQEGSTAFLNWKSQNITQAQESSFHLHGYVATNFQNKTYASIAEALLEGFDTIPVLLVSDVIENVTIPKGKSMTLDLNGHTLSGKGNESVIINHGNLLLLDFSAQKNGKITGGNAVNGGGIYNDNSLTIMDIQITGNTATGAGGGIYNIGELYLDAGACIIGNYKQEGAVKTAQNVYLKTGTLLDVSSDFSGQVGVTTESKPSVEQPLQFTKNGAACLSSFTSDEDYDLLAQNGKLYLNQLGTLSSDMFEVTYPQKLEYDGQVKTADVVLKSDFNVVGTLTVRYYKNDVLVEKPIDAGTYTVKIAVADGLYYKGTTSDLVVGNNNGQFTITPIPAIVTADDQSMKMGESVPKFTAKVSGLLGEDTIQYQLKRISVRAPGIYTIDVNGEENQGNYVVQYVSGTLNVCAGDNQKILVNDENLQEIFEKYQKDSRYVNKNKQVLINTDGPVSEDDKNLILSKIGNRKAIFYGISLQLVVDSGESSEETLDIGDENDILIAITYPFDFEDTENVGIFRAHKGVVSELKETPNDDGEYVTYDKKNDQITVVANKYSTYCIAYNEVEEAPEEETHEEEIPATGSINRLIFYGIFINLAFLAILAISKKHLFS